MNLCEEVRQIVLRSHMLHFAKLLIPARSHPPLALINVTELRANGRLLGKRLSRRVVHADVKW